MIDWDGNCEFDENGVVVRFKKPNPANSFSMRPIPQTDAVLSDAKAAKATLDVALRPPAKQELALIVKKLSLHCGMQKKAPEEVNLLFADYWEDLKAYPKFLIEEACQKYRLLPEGNDFMPSSGKLVSMMAEKLAKLNFIRRRVDKILGLQVDDTKPKQNKPVSLSEALDKILMG